MALWSINSIQNHDVYTVVYLLKDALRSALSDAWFFERAVVPKTDIKGASHAELAARLGRFRVTCKDLQEREALMLTKLLRARLWSLELRKFAPDLQPEIDQFLDATVECEDLQAEFMKDPQRMFNGGTSAWRFLTQRRPSSNSDAADESSTADSTGYLVGGRTALFELRAACDVFLGQIEETFFSDGPDSTGERGGLEGSGIARALPDFVTPETDRAEAVN